jgi:hypothetical protein
MTRAFISELPKFVVLVLFISMVAVWCAIGGGA